MIYSADDLKRAQDDARIGIVIDLITKIHNEQMAAGSRGNHDQAYGLKIAYKIVKDCINGRGTPTAAQCTLHNGEWNKCCEKRSQLHNEIESLRDAVAMLAMRLGIK